MRAYPGDNFRIVADLFNSDRLNLWKAIQNDDEQAGIGVNGDANQRVSPEFMTELLTVWRRLWVEWDSMGDVPETGDQKISFQAI